MNKAARDTINPLTIINRARIHTMYACTHAHTHTQSTPTSQSCASILHYITLYYIILDAMMLDFLLNRLIYICIYIHILNICATWCYYNPLHVYRHTHAHICTNSYANKKWIHPLWTVMNSNEQYVLKYPEINQDSAYTSKRGQFLPINCTCAIQPPRAWWGRSLSAWLPNTRCSPLRNRQTWHGAV